MGDQVQPKKGWDRVGAIFASIAKGAARAALWASAHPEVLKVIANIAASVAKAA